ncbi:MAG TPA: GEVED domain-containing protein [Bacteroidia bacterium]
MYRVLKFVLSLAFVLSPLLWRGAGGEVFAQTFTVAIPAGTPPTNTVCLLCPPTPNYEEARKPLGTYFGYERTAFIIPHSLIGHYGQITSIAVYCDSVYIPGDVPLLVYAKEVTDSVFAHLTTVAHEETAAVLTYSGTIPADSFVTKKWVTINFTTPFTHATHNKAVEFIFETNAGSEGYVDGNEGQYGKFFAHYQPANTSYVTEYWNSDNTPPIGTGVTSSFYCPVVQITIASIPACGGTPNAGTILATTDTVCLNEKVVLSLSGSIIATGLSYQWQDSIVGSTTFADIPLADSTTLLSSINTTTWYRCKVSCGTNMAYSTVKKITLRNFLQCYCTAGLSGGCAYYNTAIDSVAIPSTTLANGLTGCSVNNYYTLYPYSGNTTATLNQRSSYNLYTRYNGNVASSFWIDYNQNGSLEDNEWTQICLQSPSIYDTASTNGVVTSQVDSLFITPFVVPYNAAIGKTLLRIRTRAGGNTNDSSTACTPFFSGEVEDYYINITYPAGIQQVTGINEQVTVYPNPTKGMLNVECLMLNGNTQPLTFSISDILGNTIYHSALNTPHSTIDVSDLPAGVYQLIVQHSAFNISKRFIIEK